MYIDRSPIDRSPIDRAGGTGNYIFTLAIAGTANIAELTDRAIPLAISGTGSLIDPAFLRLFDLGISGTGSPAWDFCRLYDLGVSGTSAVAFLADRMIPLDIFGTSQFASAPLFDWYFSYGVNGTGELTTPIFDWQFAYGFRGTGGFLDTGGEIPQVHGGLLLDRGAIDRGSLGLSCVNCIPPVIVDRTIPLEIAGTGSLAWDFCRLYSLAIAGTGEVSTPLFGWYFSYGIASTGVISPIIDRTFLLDLYATGKFTSEEFTKVIELFFGGTGAIADPTVFIPIHYLTAAISGTSHFWDPALLREITNISPLIKGGTVKRSLADKMFTAQLEFAQNKNYTPLSTSPWQKVTFYQPDYAGNFHPVFMGIFPTSSQKITAASMPSFRAENETLTAYDYAWYLAAQQVRMWTDPSTGLPHNEIVLLTPADQAKQYIHRLSVTSITTNFAVGDWVTGGASHSFGLVIYVYNSGSIHYIRLMYLGNPTGTNIYYQNGETLQVGGITKAYADGHSTDETGTIVTMYPEGYVKELLGGGTSAGYDLGTHWQYTTGIYPYRMNNITSNWSLMPAIEFDFTTSTTKAQAIERICKYTKAIFYVKWRNDVTGYVGTYLPCAYLIKQSEIDSAITGLDLPAEATLSYNGGIDASDLGRYLKGEITAEFKGEDQYNFVTIRCQDLYGNWLTSANVVNTTYASDVYDPVLNPSGTAIKRSYYEENSDINNQSDLDARAVDIYAYYHYQIQTWKATFFKRSDLELLQKAYIWGFGSVVIPDGTYRIIDIQYDYADGGAKNEVTVTFIPDTQFVTYLNLRRVYYNSIYEIQNVVNDIIGTQPASLFGTITQTTATGAVTFSVQQDNAIVNYYQGYDPTKALAAGTRVLAVPDAKGKYICAKLG
jgi:hypothetical protein